MASSKGPKGLTSQKGQHQSPTKLSDQEIERLTYERIAIEGDGGDFQNQIHKNRAEPVPWLNGDLLPKYLSPSETNPLGNFHGLSLELRLRIVDFLPYEDARAFMLVNKTMSNAVVANLKYQNLTQHCQEILTTLWQTELRSCFSMDDLYQVLTNPQCAYCPYLSFGAYVFVPDLVRCCEHCALKDPRCLAVPVERAMKKGKIHEDREYGLTKISIQRLPIMKAFPSDSRFGRELLISRSLAQQAMIKQILRQHPKRPLSDIPHVTTCGLESHGQPDSRLPAITPMPYFDPDTKTIVKGRRCTGCRQQFGRAKHYCSEEDCAEFGGGPDNWNAPRWKCILERWRKRKITCKAFPILMKEFLPDAFREHFKKCKHAQKLYAKLFRKKVYFKASDKQYVDSSEMEDLKTAYSDKGDSDEEEWDQDDVESSEYSEDSDSNSSSDQHTDLPGFRYPSSDESEDSNSEASDEQDADSSEMEDSNSEASDEQDADSSEMEGSDSEASDEQDGDSSEMADSH